MRLIFERQLELIHKYHPIESRNGFHIGDGIPLNLDNKRDQHRLKDMSWRVVEEIAEALDCSMEYEHHVEELIDGLHFLVELMILSGIQHDEVNMYVNKRKEGESILVPFIRELGNAMNCLKNKPWKQTHMLTDAIQYRKRLTNAWYEYMSILHTNLNNREIFILYFKKAAVNSFRQRSNY